MHMKHDIQADPLINIDGIYDLRNEYKKKIILLHGTFRGCWLGFTPDPYKKMILSPQKSDQISVL